MTDEERPFTRDFEDLFSTLMVSLPLTAHRVRFQKIDHTFTSEEAINNLGLRERLSSENTIDRSRITPRMEEFAKSVTLKEIPPGPLKPTGHKMFRSERGKLMEHVCPIMDNPGCRRRRKAFARYLNQHGLLGRSRAHALPGGKSSEPKRAGAGIRVSA